MKRLLIIFSLLAFMLPLSASAATVQVSAWGGGAGGRTNGAGGGGGAYAGLNAFTITSLTGYSVTVGAAGGVSSGNGATTTFNGSWPTATLQAAPGFWNLTTFLSTGGLAASSTGDVLHSGGNGGAGANPSGGGGGGGAGGTTAVGNIGATGNSTSATGGTGGSVGGGNGGNGGCSSASTVGTVPGGGGGGGGGSGCASRGASAGAAGEVIITAPLSTGITATGGTHTSDATNDYWTFTSSGTWTPTAITPPATGFINGLQWFFQWLW